MKKFLLASIFYGLTISSGLAAEQIIPTETQKSLSLVIYNENRALVNDTRPVSLQTGDNPIAFSGISAQIIPESALLQGDDIVVLEQNFNYDLLSYSSLMEKAIGSTVTLQYIHPNTGNVTTQSGKLLAFNDNQPIFEINGKIEASYPGRVLFNKIPDQLRARPTLVMNIQSQKSGQQDLSLGYLTHGLSWQANYVAKLNETETQMDLTGFVTLNNQSGTDYKNARLQLVAGDVNLVQEYIQPRLYMAKSADAMLASASANEMAVENLSDFYLYTLPRKTDILSNQTKQVNLLSAQFVPVKKSYEFDNSLRPYATELKNVKPQIYLTFDNTKQNNLGIALPKGVVRLYKSDAQNNMLFVGEDRIKHTGNLETVRLHMGEAFDLSANAKRTSYSKLASNLTESTYEITFKNGGSKNAQVIVYQNFSGTFNILSETVPSQKITANRVQWIIDIPAGGEKLLQYKIRIEND